MNCVKCKKKADIRTQTLSVCKGCFVKIIEKRIRKVIRLGKYFRKGDSILIIDDGSAESKAAISILPEILDGLCVKIFVKKSVYTLGKKINTKCSKIIVPGNGDREASEFLTSVFENKEFRYSGNFKLNGKTYIKLFLPCLGAEVETYARIKKLKFKKMKIKSMAQDMLDSLEKGYPELKFCLLKSSREINKKNN